MPSLVIVEQLRPSTELADPLPEDVAIIVQWTMQDEHNRPIHSQTCSLTFSAGAPLVVDVPIAERTCAFRLGKGTHITLPLTAQVTVNLAARDAHAAGPLTGTLETRLRSTNQADSDASKTVYSELNQELRRTRTLYETFLIVVTGALATVFSKRSDIAGSYHASIGYGLGFLALIVIYMIWQIAERYRKTTSAVFNLERSWGLRPGSGGEYPLEGDVSWWRNHAWRHTIWAIGLTAYALLAIGIVIATLRTHAEPAKASTAPVSVPCSCCTPSGATQITPGPRASASGKKAGGKVK